MALPTARPATRFARLDLSCGSVDAMRAVGFARRFPPHFHDTFAIGVHESGTFRLRTARGEWIAGRGSVLTLSPGEIHSAEPLSPDGFSYRMVYPTTAFLHAIGIVSRTLDRGAPLFRAPMIHDPELAQTFEQAHRPLLGGARSSEAEGELLACLHDLVDRYGARATGATGLSGRERSVVEQARAYLGARAADRICLATLAAVCGISTFHLIRVFRRAVGMTPYAYAVQLRVNRAQAMLRSGHGVARVAYACGFSDQSHLTRAFKRVVGVPPGHYVRSLRGVLAG